MLPWRLNLLSEEVMRLCSIICITGFQLFSLILLLSDLVKQHNSISSIAGYARKF